MNFWEFLNKNIVEVGVILILLVAIICAAIRG